MSSSATRRTPGRRTGVRSAGAAATSRPWRSCGTPWRKSSRCLCERVAGIEALKDFGVRARHGRFPHRSLFRYNNGDAKGRVAEAHARNVSLQQLYDEWARARCPDSATCSPDPSLLLWHAPASALRPDLPWAAANAFFPLKQPVDAEHILKYVAQRYAVVGVLERLDETLGVLRCRLPWLRGGIFPRANPTRPYPELLRDDVARLRRVGKLAFDLYDLAGGILTADSSCCQRLWRQGGGEEPPAAAPLPNPQAAQRKRRRRSRRSKGSNH